MSKKSILITGGNRGIGLAFVKAFSEADYSVITTVRNKNDANELKSIKNVLVLELDCSSHESIQSFDKDWPMQSLDILINNSGVFEPEILNQESLHQVFQVNSGNFFY